MIDADRLELVDTGDGVPLTKCEQNLYEALANVQDSISNRRIWPLEISLFDEQGTVKRLEDALADVSDLVAEVKRSQYLVARAEEQWNVDLSDFEEEE